MSDEVEITHGGAIAVDPEALRAVGESLAAFAPKFADAASAVRRAHGCLSALPYGSRYVDTSALWSSADRAEALHEECRSTAEGTLLMADAYELVERRIELDGLAIQGKAPTDELLDRITELETSNPLVLEMETWLIEAWKQDGVDQMTPDLSKSLLTSAMGVALGMTMFVGATGLGRLPPGATLSGSGVPVSVTPVPGRAPVGPPGTMAEAFRRFPDSDGAQIRVEKYVMPDGSKKFILYEKGTQINADSDEAFDLVESNRDLYVDRKESASYAATIAALEAAGAEPGDELQVYAHSQAAMNAAYLATQSEFNVSVVVTAGSPTSPMLREDQLFIQLLHTDDIVGGLGAGGMPGGSGSPDSVRITRDADPNDFLWNTHPLETYIETAELAEDTSDVRIDAWYNSQRELLEGELVESTEYIAKRE